ncbi:Protein 108 [Linum perenne]
MCGEFMVRRSIFPSTECCSVVKSAQHDCLCNTIWNTARLPSTCGLPPLNCPVLSNWYVS